MQVIYVGWWSFQKRVNRAHLFGVHLIAVVTVETNGMRTFSMFSTWRHNYQPYSLLSRGEGLLGIASESKFLQSPIANRNSRHTINYPVIPVNFRTPQWHFVPLPCI